MELQPEARLLSYFLAIAEELNFTRAAARVGIAQPALSASMRRLEAQLGVQLLERTTRAVSLTPAGEALRRDGPAALAGLASAWDATRRAGRGEEGHLRLGYGISTGYETTPRLLEALRDRYPGIEVSADVLSGAEIVRAVATGERDAGLARTPPHDRGVRAETVRIERQGALVATDHPLAGAVRLTVDQLAAFPVLLHPRADNPGHHDRIVALLDQGGRAPEYAPVAMGFDPSHTELRKGVAVGIASEPVALAGSEGLRWIPIDHPGALIETALLVRAPEPTALARRFRAVAMGEAADRGWLDPIESHPL